MITPQQKQDMDRNRISVMQTADAFYFSQQNKITEKFLQLVWKGRRCFIVGGGESAIDFDFSRLTGEKSIGVNMAFMKYPFDINYMMDITFYNDIQSGAMDRHTGEEVFAKWYEFQGTKAILCPNAAHTFDDSVYLVRRHEIPKVNTNISEGIYGGSNSGYGALMLAIALGANPIYLIGYDLKVENKTHWHKGYPNQTYVEQRDKCKHFREGFEIVAPQIEALGIKVYNTFKDSGIKCFEYKDINEVLR